MEALHPPPPYSRADDDRLTLPSLPAHPTPNTAVNLPDLRSLKLPISSQSTLLPPPQQPPTPQWQSYPRPTYAPPYGGAVSLPPPSPMEIDDSARIRAPSIVSLDDPETREAAETLSGLRNMDFHNRSPSSTRSTSSPHAVSPPWEPLSTNPPEDPPEPLLSLITSSHPWLGGTINSGMYAYNSTMNYSPAFIASFVERNMSYFATGLGTVSRRTGVESRVRQYLSSTAGSPRRGRVPSSPRAIAMPTDEEAAAAMVYMDERRRSRASSMASFTSTLPAYEAEGSAPAYALSRTGSASGPAGGATDGAVKRAAAAVAAVADRNWSTRVMITTSGLGVALSDRSLRSLRYCLSVLRGATDHLADVMGALRTLLDEYEEGVDDDQTNGTNGVCEDDDAAMTDAPSFPTPEQSAARARALGERIKGYGSDIMATLQSVTTHVSRYTGGALPENAGALVRRQLMSVPQRWRVAQEAARQQRPRARLSSPQMAGLLPRLMGTEAGEAADVDVEDGAALLDDVAADEETAPGDGSVGSGGSSDGGDPLRAGRKWIVFAEQGCEMISQVSLVLSGTVDSAESWLDSMGRRPNGANSTNGFHGEPDDKNAA